MLCIWFYFLLKLLLTCFSQWSKPLFFQWMVIIKIWYNCSALLDSLYPFSLYLFKNVTQIIGSPNILKLVKIGLNSWLHTLSKFIAFCSMYFSVWEHYNHFWLLSLAHSALIQIGNSSPFRFSHKNFAQNKIYKDLKCVQWWKHN